MSDAPRTIMQRLKEETWPMHQRAEQQPLEQKLIKGEITKDGFCDYLAQRYLVHTHLDPALSAGRAKHAALAAVVHDYQFHGPRAAEDLKFFGKDPASYAPVAGTTKLNALIDKLAASDPVALLGIQYVIEGSTNGARFIARSIRGALRLQGAEGTKYLDPYGDQQRERWAEFKRVMDSHAFTPEEANRIVAAAMATFEAIIELDAALQKEAA